METLIIKRDSKIYLNEVNILSQETTDLNSYIIGFLDVFVSFEEGLTLFELIKSIEGINKFISSYYLDEYEVLRALCHASKLRTLSTSLKLYKNFIVETEDILTNNEKNYVNIVPMVEFLSEEEKEKKEKIGELPIVINEDIEFIQLKIDKVLKSRFTLQDVLTCLFSELLWKLKNESGNILKM